MTEMNKLKNKNTSVENTLCTVADIYEPFINVNACYKQLNLN